MRLDIRVGTDTALAAVLRASADAKTVSKEVRYIKIRGYRGYVLGV